MSAFIGWIANLGRQLAYWFSELIRQAIKFTTAAWGVVVIGGAIAYIFGVYAVRGFNLILDMFNGLSPGSWNNHPPGSISFLLQVANTFTPLDEFCGFLAAYLSLFLVLAGYRFIKSWIPTVSST